MTAPTRHSRIFRGHVTHHRHHPRRHRFRYGIDMLYLDLDEADEVFAGSWLWGVDRRRLFSIRRDELFSGGGALADRVQDEVAKRTGARPGGPVRVLTLPRVLGRGFNPVSFYYCFGPDGTQLRAILSEITNTPWGERHSYVIPARDDQPIREQFAKDFHISPFLDMDLDYDWRFSRPGERLEVCMDCHREGELQLRAALELRARPLTRRNLFYTALRQPLMGVGVLAAIYLQAARLRWKGIPFHPHPATPTEPHETCR